MLTDLDGDGEPTCMDEDESYVWGDEPSPLLGYALDGFPIYGPYGCIDAECVEVVEFQSSWENMSHSAGTEGCTATADCGNPSFCADSIQNPSFDPNECEVCAETIVNGERTTACIPLAEAWVHNQYVEKAGDQWLDQCNGRVGPDGTYRYHATSTFPYILGCYAGTPSAGTGAGGSRGTGQGNGNGEGSGSGTGTSPQSCNTEVDCVDACSDSAVGCTCAEGPNGKMCVPTCTTDSDCPDDSMQLICDEGKGICIPSGGPPGG
jgi:hypothetical protein